jgi:predicted acetyltransferase
MCCERLKLVEPAIVLKDEFLAMAKEFLSAGQQKEGWLLDEALDDFEKYVAKLNDHAKGRNLPQGWVPATSYWLLGSSVNVLGYSSLRHRLSPQLRRFGGHIGYGIRPTQRNKGYGSCICKLTLDKARLLGLKRLLITCDDNNHASARIIENCGGLLEDKVMNKGRDVPTRRYWIEVG